MKALASRDLVCIGACASRPVFSYFFQVQQTNASFSNRIIYSCRIITVIESIILPPTDFYVCASELGHWDLEINRTLIVTVFRVVSRGFESSKTNSHSIYLLIVCFTNFFMNMHFITSVYKFLKFWMYCYVFRKSSMYKNSFGTQVVEGLAIHRGI